MSITSYGYDGTLTEVGWGLLSRLLGTRHSVDDAASLLVTTTSGTRAFQVAAGTAFGAGVVDVNSAPIVLSSSAPGSGERWDTVVVRRNWSTNSSTLVVVAGTSSKALAAGLNSSPGVLDDQPIALVRVSSASTVVLEIVDLRNQAGALRNYPSLSALQLDPVAAAEGSLAVVADAAQKARLYVRSGGSWVLKDGVGSSADWAALSLGSTLTTFDVAPAYVARNGFVVVRGTVKRSDGNNLVGGTTYAVGTLPAGFRPGATWNYAVAASVAGSGVPARANVQTSGVISVVPPYDVPWLAIDTVFPMEA